MGSLEELEELVAVVVDAPALLWLATDGRTRGALGLTGFLSLVGGMVPAAVRAGVGDGAVDTGRPTSTGILLDTEVFEEEAIA